MIFDRAIVNDANWNQHWKCWKSAVICFEISMTHGIYLFFQEQVPFIFVGTVESIENAKLLLEYHLQHLKVLSQPLLTSVAPSHTNIVILTAPAYLSSLKSH